VQHNLSREGKRLPVKNLLLLFTFVFVLWLPLWAQESSSKEEAKETSAQGKAEKAKLGRWEGIVTGTHEDKSTLTVRRRNGFEQTIHYDSSTQWTSQEHHSQRINTIDASQVKIWDRVICVGYYDEKGHFHAALISKRLSK
jgi:alkaline phosphatase